MPVHKNDLPESDIKIIITCPSELSPEMIVRFKDGNEQIIEGGLVKLFIDKYTDAKNRGIVRTIGYGLEEKLRYDFRFLFQQVI